MDGLNEKEGGFEKFTRAYEEYGIHVKPDGTIVGKEWAPGAEALYLAGTFSKFMFVSQKVLQIELFNVQILRLIGYRFVHS